MPVSSLSLFLGLENVWLCDNIKSIAYLKCKYTYNFFFLIFFVCYFKYSVWKISHIRCGLKLFKNLTIRNLSGRAMSELFELWPACFHTKWAKFWKLFGKPHNGRWIFFFKRPVKKNSRIRYLINALFYQIFRTLCHTI